MVGYSFTLGGAPPHPPPLPQGEGEGERPDLIPRCPPHPAVGHLLPQGEGNMC